MAWKGRKPNPVDFAPLKITLNKTDLQVKNFPLFQVLSELIDKSQQSKDQINNIINTFIGDVTITDDVDLSAILAALSKLDNIINFATFWTQNDEAVNLPSSRQVIAGTGITLDYSVPNQVTISSSGSGAGLVPMTTGAYPGAIMFIGQRVMMVYP